MFSFLKQLYLLAIRLPFLKAKNQFKVFRMEDVLKYIALGVFAFGVAWAEYAFFDRFWSLLETVPFGFALLLPRFFSLIGSFMIVFLSYSSFLTALSLLYRSEDLSFLLAAPTSVSLVLFTKWNDVAIRSGATLFLLALPPMISLGHALDLGLPFYLGYIAAALAFSSLGVCAGTWLAMGMTAVFPVKRMHQTAAILGLCIAVIAITGLRFLHIETMWSEQALANPLILFLQQDSMDYSKYSPGQLFADAIVPFVSPGNTYAGFGIVLIVGALGVILTVVLGRNLFLHGWWKSQEQGDPEVRASWLMANRELPRKRTSLFWTLMWKDWLIFTRDPTIWTQLFMMIPLAGLYLLNLSFLPLKGEDLIPFFAAGDVGLVGLIVAAIGGRFLFPSASREGRAVWIPAVAPIPAGKMIMQKTLFNIPPVMFLAVLLLTGSAKILNLPLVWTIWSLGYGLLLSLLICLLAVFLGFCFPSYSYRHLMEVSLGKGAFLFMILGLAVIVSFEYAVIRIVLMAAEPVLSLVERDLILWVAGWLAMTGVIYAAGKRRWSFLNDRAN